jgi:hypothetical protein
MLARGPAHASTSFAVPGGDWKLIDGQLKVVSAGNDGSLWGVNELENVYLKRSVAAPWEAKPGWKLRQISACDANTAVGVNDAQEIYKIEHGNLRRLPGAATWASIGADGAIWVVNAAGSIYSWDEASSNWQARPGAAVQISVGNSHQVYVTTSSHDVFRWHGSDWAHVDGIKLKRVAVSADGAVAGVTDSDDIMFFDGAKWHNIPGKLSEVDVKGGLLVGANS